MSAGSSFSLYKRHLHRMPPGQRINWLVIVGVATLLLLVVGALKLYLYRKSLEKPYIELKGYRVATAEAFDEFLRRRDNRTQFAELSHYLEQQGVGDVTAAENLLRQGSDWLDIREPPFALPPREQWRNMIATLAIVRDEVQPVLGPLDVISAYRTANYNRKIGGSDGSRHRDFCGLDLVPKSNISRKELVEELRNLHARLGPQSNLGLGIYNDVRFHIDTCGYRSW